MIEELCTFNVWPFGNQSYNLYIFISYGVHVNMHSYAYAIRWMVWRK